MRFGGGNYLNVQYTLPERPLFPGDLSDQTTAVPVTGKSIRGTPRLKFLRTEPILYETKFTMLTNSLPIHDFCYLKATRLLLCHSLDIENRCLRECGYLLSNAAFPD
jgi:hypothetical protein